MTLNKFKYQNISIVLNILISKIGFKVKTIKLKPCKFYNFFFFFKVNNQIKQNKSLYKFSNKTKYVAK